MRDSVALVDRILPVDNSPYLTAIYHGIGFFITGVYLRALIHQLTICPHPETASQAQVCNGSPEKDYLPSFPR